MPLIFVTKNTNYGNTKRNYGKMYNLIWFLFGLGLGLALDWVLVKFMLKDIKNRLLSLEKEVYDKVA
jgi:hypothetical protein